MSNPSIIIDPNEARDIEKNLILREIYYRPTGYFSNAKTLRDECKKWVAVLNIVDISSRFKASVPLTSKKSSEVAKAFRKIYDDPKQPSYIPDASTL
ncbi:9805_t:CDS:2 [Entrophospora sp. SA101]|nr:15905_t:CDS:2 [Entrophospora sp. SA101]CAJ0905499.1 9805_t:CDS:2 [Entrophospora sp. SA101]